MKSKASLSAGLKMHLYAVAYTAKVHVRQIQPVVFLLYMLPLCVFIALGEPATGVILLGGGILVAINGAINFVLACNGHKLMPRALGQAGLAAILFWMVWYGQLLSAGPILINVVVFALSVAMYAVHRSKSAKFSMVVKDHDADSVNRFEKLAQDAGVKFLSPFKSGKMRLLALKRNYWLATDVGEHTTYVVEGEHWKPVPQLEEIFSQLKGVFHTQFGCAFTPSVYKEYLEIDRILAAPNRVVDAFVYGNSFTIVLEPIDDRHDSAADSSAPDNENDSSGLRTITFAFGPTPLPDEPFLKVLIDVKLKELCILDFVVGDDLVRVPCEALIDGDINVSISHVGPLDMFGRSLSCSLSKGGEEHHFAVRFAGGEVLVEPHTKRRGAHPCTLPLRAYLDFWSSYSPSYTNRGDAESRKLYCDSNIAMAPRGSYDIIGYDHWDYSQYRVPTCGTLYEAVFKALKMSQEATSRVSEETYADTFYVYNHDGDELFSTVTERSVVPEPLFITKMIQYSRPYWMDLKDTYLKFIAGIFSILCLISVPLLVSPEQVKNSVYSWFIYVPLMILSISLAYTLREVAYLARTGLGKISSLFANAIGLTVAYGVFAMCVSFLMSWFR